MVGLFGISLVDGPLNSVVLFSQLLPYMSIYAGGRINTFNKSHLTLFRFLYGMWNLDFFELVTSNFCVLPIQSAMEMLIFKNLTPVLLGFALSCLYIMIPQRRDIVASLENSNTLFRKFVSHMFCKLCCKCPCLSYCEQKYIKAINWLNRKVCGRDMSQPTTCFRSQSLITCVILCYAKLITLAFDLLSNTTLYGRSKDDSNEFLLVFWLDGTRKYVEDTAWTLLVAIICIIIIILIPLVIILYPTFAHYYNSNRRAVPNYISHFSDSLRLCYKNNRITCRFTAIYFFYRIGALAIYAFTTTVYLQYLWQCGFFLSILLIHCVVQPYKIRIYNIIDGIIFFNMTLISLLSLYRLYAVDAGLSETTKASWFQLILIYLPFVYIVLLWPCIRFYKYIKKRQPNGSTSSSCIGKLSMKLIVFVDDNLLIEDARRNNIVENDELLQCNQ